MSRLSPSVLVIILMVSLLFVYLIPGDGSSVVGIISLFILGLGMILAFGGRAVEQRETARKMLGTLTGITAVASAALIGQHMANGNLLGFVCAPVLLAGLYIGFITLITRAGLVVEEGEVLVSRRRMDHQHIIRPPGLHSPIVAGLEAAIAVMPTYDIQTEASVDQVDTVYLHKVDQINVDTTCRIIQHFPEGDEVLPTEMRYEGFLKLPYHYPNRDRIFKDLADEMGVTVQEAKMNATFWIRAIQLQVEQAINEELRGVIHDEEFFNPQRNETGPLGPTDISAMRNEVSEALQKRLQERMHKWGVEMTEVSITQVILDPARIQFHYKSQIMEMEARDAERRAQLEALQKEIVATTEHKIRQHDYELEEEHQKKQVQVELAALRERHTLDSGAVIDMINEFMETMRHHDATLDADDIQRLLLMALEEHRRNQYRTSGAKQSGTTNPTNT